MAEDSEINPNPNDDVKEFCQVNVGGKNYKISKDTMSSVSGSRLHRIANDNKYGGFFERPRVAFEAILAYHQTGELHMPENMCPGAFKKEMEFWDVDPHLMENCCYHRYVMFMKDLAIMSGFHAKTVQKEEKQQTLLFDRSTKLSRLRAQVWGVLDNTNDSIGTKIYFSVATTFILMAIFATALGTLPKTSTDTDIDIDTNTTLKPAYKHQNNSDGIDRDIGGFEDVPEQFRLNRRVRRSIPAYAYLDRLPQDTQFEHVDVSDKEDEDHLVEYLTENQLIRNDNWARQLLDIIRYHNLLHLQIEKNTADDEASGKKENRCLGKHNKKRNSEEHQNDFIRHTQQENKERQTDKTYDEHKGKKTKKQQEVQTDHHQDVSIGADPIGNIAKPEDGNKIEQKQGSRERYEKGYSGQNEQWINEQIRREAFRKNRMKQTEKNQQLNIEKHRQGNSKKYQQGKTLIRSQNDLVNEVGSKRKINLFRDSFTYDSGNSLTTPRSLTIRKTLNDDLLHSLFTFLLSRIQNEQSKNPRHVRISRSPTSNDENNTRDFNNITREYENFTDRIDNVSRNTENLTNYMETATQATIIKNQSMQNETVELSNYDRVDTDNVLHFYEQNNTLDQGRLPSISRDPMREVIDTILPESPTSKILTLETAIDEGQMTYMYIEYATNAFFSFELLCRLLFCPRSIRYFFSFQNVIDMLVLAAIYTRAIFISLDIQGYQSYIDILLYMQMLRVIRLLRLLDNVTAYKVLCYAMRVGKKDIFLIVLYVFIGVLFFSNFIYFFERNEDFPSIPDAWWWSLVTITTVGYGDMAPKTVIGKIIGSVCALSGVFMFSLIIPIFVNTFLSIYQFAEVRNLNGDHTCNLVTKGQESVKEPTLI